MKDQIKETINILTQVEETGSRNAKAAILEGGANNLVLKKILYFAYNPYYTYGLYRIPAYKASPLSDPEVNFTAFVGLCTAMRNRTLTGNELKKSIASFLATCTIDEAKWFSRVWQKDLKIGLLPLSINKIFPDLIPTFDVMLASPYDEKKLEYPVYAEPKIDGVRCIAAIDTTVSMLTRNGHDLGNFPHIREALFNSFPPGTVVDGELVSPQGFQDTMKQVFRKDNIDTSMFCYHIFDVLTITEFNVTTKTPYVSRLNRRKEYGKKNKYNGILIFVPSRFCTDDKMVKETYDLAIAEGYEGLVLKDPEAHYVQKRSRAWMKVKSDSFGGCVDVDLPVIDYEMGEGKLSRMIGALVCSYNGKLVKVGTGLTDADRKHLKKKIDNKEGVIIRVIAQEETEDGSLRFPRFVGERKDLV